MIGYNEMKAIYERNGEQTKASRDHHQDPTLQEWFEGAGFISDDVVKFCNELGALFDLNAIHASHSRQHALAISIAAGLQMGFQLACQHANLQYEVPDAPDT